MTLARRVEFLETLEELQKDLATLSCAVEDPEVLSEVLGSVRGGVDELEELAQTAKLRLKAEGS